MKLRKLVLYFSILLSFLAPIQAQANATRSEPVNENLVFQGVNDYYFSITPIAITLGCGLSAGLPGLALGLIASGADEALLHYGYTSQRHLSLGILAASTAATLGLPYYIAEVVAFGLSTGITTGTLEVESAQLTPPMNAMMAGTALANAHACPGYAGALLGLAAYGFDQWQNTTVVSESLENIAAISVFVPLAANIVTYGAPKALAYLPSSIRNRIFASTASTGPITTIVTSTMAAEMRKADARKAEKIRGLSISAGVMIVAIYKGTQHKTEESESIVQGAISPEQFQKDLSAVFQRLTNSTIVDEITREQIAYRLATASALVQINFQWSADLQNTFERMSALAPGNHAAQSLYNNALAKLVVLLIADLSFDFVTKSIISRFQTERLSRILTASMRQRVMKGEAPLRLRANETLEADVNKFDENIATLSGTGINLIWSTTDSYTTSLQSSILLFNNNALDALVLLQSYTTALSSLQAMLENEIEAIDEKIKVASDQIKSLESDLKKKPKIVIGGRKQDLLHGKILDLEAKIRTYNADKFKWETLLQLLNTSRRYSDYMATNFLISQKITNRQLDRTAMFTSRDATRDILSSGSWYLNNQANIKRVQVASKGLLNVMDFLDKPCDDVSTLKTSHSVASENSIHFDNFKIGILNPLRELLVADKFELKAGRYVVTGASGAGKSSFLSKIRGMKCNGIYAHGNIEFRATEISNDPVYELTQEDYIAPNSTLLENLTGRTSKELEGDSELRERVTRYLAELKIDDLGTSGLASNLDEEKNWGDTLSGGQKRKLAIVAMLLQKPKFVIMDETFAGMDEQAIKRAQRLIKTELAESVILIVDHQADANNFEDFYQENLHLENQSLVLRPVGELTH